MRLSQLIKNKIFKKNKLERLNGTPNNERLTYISDPEQIRIQKSRSYRVWFYGDGDELLNWYTNQQAYGWLSNPIYNRNKRNFFWGQSVAECNIKRIHSGVPKAIVDTIVNVVGKQTISCDDNRLTKILDINKYHFRLNQQVRPNTLVQGDGCWKINFNKNLSSVPLLEWYGTEDWEPIEKSGILFGIIFKTYYKDKKDNNYVLLETRSLVSEGCFIEYQLFILEKQNELKSIDFTALPELTYLKDRNKLLIRGIHKLFAVPTMYYYDPLYKNRGKSIYDGKVDQFDMLDEILSQASQTNRVSTPVEYFDTDMLERTKDGKPIYPPKYNRQFINKLGKTDGDGLSKGNGITTTQPQLNFDQYGRLASDVLSYILLGILSPSSLGIDVAKKDNADAQREKEKQTIFTRDTICDNETIQSKELLNMLLIMQDYMDTGIMVDKDYDISIKYDEFANPSFESELQVLGPAWNNGQISTKKYAELLWAGKLSEQELNEEIAYLDENKKQDDLDLGALMNENRDNTAVPTSKSETTESEVIE